MQLPTPPLLLLMLLWRSLHCESAISRASKVSKRQLHYGESFAAPGYQMNFIRNNQEANAFLQSSRLLYDPGYNAQDSHEVRSDLTSRSANSAVATMVDSSHPPHQFQQRPQEAGKFDNMANGVTGVHYAAPQTFSHIYFPHVYSPSSQIGPGRTAPHVFPGDTADTMAARNNGQSYSTSSNYFVPMSVLYHPNVGPQQQHIQPQRQPQQQQHHHQQLQAQNQQQTQQQQHTQAYNSLPPPLLPPPAPPPLPAQFQNYAPQPPPLAGPPSQPPSPQSQQQQQQQQSHEQQQSTSQQTVYQHHSQQPPSAQAALPPPLPPLPPLPRLPHLPHGQQPPPPPQNFQAPFRASQFLGYMHDTMRGGMPHMRGGGADERAPLYTDAYSMMGAAPPLQQPLVKPIYERMRENFMNDAAQQNYQAGTTQHARYGRYIYMAPSNMYALFKAA